MWRTCAIQAMSWMARTNPLTTTLVPRPTYVDCAQEKNNSLFPKKIRSRSKVFVTFFSHSPLFIISFWSPLTQKSATSFDSATMFRDRPPFSPNFIDIQLSSECFFKKPWKWSLTLSPDSTSVILAISTKRKEKKNMSHREPTFTELASKSTNGLHNNYYSDVCFMSDITFI